MNMLTKSLTAAALAAGIAVGGASVASASSQPWWGAAGFSPGQEMEMRLLLGNVNRQFQPQIVETAGQVCAVLRDGGSPAQALDVAAGAGYVEGYQRGHAVGTMVDVMCPDMVAVIR